MGRQKMAGVPVELRAWIEQFCREVGALVPRPYTESEYASPNAPSYFTASQW